MNKLYNGLVMINKLKISIRNTWTPFSSTEKPFASFHDPESGEKGYFMP